MSWPRMMPTCFICSSSAWGHRRSGSLLELSDCPWQGVQRRRSRLLLSSSPWAGQKGLVVSPFVHLLLSTAAAGENSDELHLVAGCHSSQTPPGSYLYLCCNSPHTSLSMLIIGSCGGHPCTQASFYMPMESHGALSVKLRAISAQKARAPPPIPQPQGLIAAMALSKLWHPTLLRSLGAIETSSIGLPCLLDVQQTRSKHKSTSDLRRQLNRLQNTTYEQERRKAEKQVGHDMQIKSFGCSMSFCTHLCQWLEL